MLNYSIEVELTLWNVLIQKIVFIMCFHYTIVVFFANLLHLGFAL